MMYATAEDGRRVQAAKGLAAACPCCQSEVIAKCGSVVVHHWAHKSLKDCDSWSEGETEWHRAWKERFPEECREVVMGCHRADVRLPDRDGVVRVIEFQHSPISVEEAAEREAFYGPGLVWVFDERQSMIKRGDYAVWKRKKRPRACLTGTSRETFLDLGDVMFEVVRVCRREAVPLTTQEQVALVKARRGFDQTIEDGLKLEQKIISIEDQIWIAKRKLLFDGVESNIEAMKQNLQSAKEYLALKVAENKRHESVVADLTKIRTFASGRFLRREEFVEEFTREKKTSLFE